MGALRLTLCLRCRCRAPQVPPAAHDVDARLNFVAPPPAVVESMQARAHADGRRVPAGSQPWRAKWEWAKYERA